MACNLTRRNWLKTASAAAYLAGPRFACAAAPSSPVSIARCKTYSPCELVPVMQKMFDQLGGLERLVKNKTVAVKINLTGSPRQGQLGVRFEF